ncbi:MAG: glycosyltransferase family 2 protein [Candidatus Shapirobacteria bacterium]
MKFSIITPSYNQGQFIQETINSVVGQIGDFEIEYFIMDGGSTDDTVKILKATEIKLKNNSKIKYYWQSKSDNGQVDAINQALAKATGDVVAYINSDDYYLPNAFDTVSKYFNNHPKSQWVVGNCQVSDPRLNWTFWLKHIWPIQCFKSALYVFNTINQPSVFLKSSLVKKVGKFNPQYHFAFDYDYWLRCQKRSLPSRIHTFLSVFRIHPQSKGNTGFKKQFDEDWLVFISHHPKSIFYFAHALAKDFVKSIYKKIK